MLIAAMLIAVGIVSSIVFMMQASERKNVLIRGSGATFPESQIRAWITVFTKNNPDVKVEYAGVGSGQGQSDFIEGINDFAGSDPPLKTEAWEKAVKKYGRVYQFPIIAGGVALVYNIPELPEDYVLKISSEVLVNILLGKIRYWNDERIKELNREVADKLPHKEIIFVHRSDSSGTTKIFTTYLSKVSKEWKEKVGSGKLVEWPLANIGRAIGAKGNPGVAASIKNTPYSLGYVELAYAKDLKVAALQNNDGYFILPNEETIKEALINALKFIPEIKDPAVNLEKYDIIAKMLNPPGKNSYPIVSFSHFIVKDSKNYSPEKAEALAKFIEWILTEGQKEEYIVDGYVPLPSEIAQIGLKVAEELRSG